MAKTHPNHVFHKSGITLIEMMVFLWLLAGILFGIIIGIKIGSEHGTWMTLFGIVSGAIAGGLAAIGGIILIISFFCFIAMIIRILEPADLVCRCRELNTPTPEHLIADTPIKQEAVAESHKLLEWTEFAQIRNAPPFTKDILQKRLAGGTLSQEQIALAANLGDSAAAALGITPIEPVLYFKGWDKMPNDIQKVLRSGLPPRLCMVWAMSCVERVLETFEKEFHQDTRPRQAFGAALLVLRDNNSEAKELCHDFSNRWWDVSKAGCRVLHRDLIERMKGGRSLGEKAAATAYRFVRYISEFLEPTHLWINFSRNSQSYFCATPQTRCDWSQPCYSAESVIYEASHAAARPEVEQQWHREELIRMILGWERWNQDRLIWQTHVDEEWIPKIRAELKDVNFDIPAYIELVRKQLVPWRNQGM